MKVFNPNQEYLWELYEYNLNISQDYFGRMSQEFNDIEMDEQSIYPLDMNKNCELCYNVDKPVQSKDADKMMASLNFAAKGQCCMHYFSETGHEERNLCIKDQPDSCFKVAEEVAGLVQQQCYSRQEVPEDQQTPATPCPHTDNTESTPIVDIKWREWVYQMSDMMIKQLIGIRIRYGMRHSESSRRQVNDTLQEVFYEDSTIGMLASTEYSAAERTQLRDKAPYLLDDDVTIVEQFQYQVEREQNALRIFKDKVDGKCEIEGLCHFRRVHEKQNLRLHVYQIDMQHA